MYHLLTTLRRGMTATGTTTALRVEGTIKLLLSLANRKYILFMVAKNEKWDTFLQNFFCFPEILNLFFKLVLRKNFPAFEKLFCARSSVPCPYIFKWIRIQIRGYVVILFFVYRSGFRRQVITDPDPTWTFSKASGKNMLSKR